MRSTGALTIVATHYPELKLWAHATEGAINASVEFDPETLRPTYKLTVGLPGRSNAFAIATRLGLQDEIVSHARSMVAESDLKAEDLLAELHQQRDAVERSREAAERARLEVEASARQLRERLDHIEAERAAILETAQAEAQQQLDALRDEIDRVRAQLSAAQRQGEVEAIEAQAAELAEQVEASVPPAPIEKPSLGPRHPVRVGDAVFVNKLDTAGEVISIDGGIIEVLVGTMRMKTRLDEIEWRSSPSVSDSPTHSESADSLRLATTARLELDLRGLRADEAVAEVERQIDAAYLSGFPFVRIIHGKGSGALRKAVREALQTNPAVKAVQAGKEEEGGDGVTIAVLASDS